MKEGMFIKRSRSYLGIGDFKGFRRSLITLTEVERLDWISKGE